MSFDDVLTFWFEELTLLDQFKGGVEIDDKIKKKFGGLHHKAALGELFVWRKDPHGRLAEIIVLDQFSRNIYRGDKRAFEFDLSALCLAQEAINLGVDRNIEVSKRSFIYLPFMHSESIIMHEKAIELFGQKGLEQSYDFELKHKKIIEKFGRYPHRNEIMGRISTPEEIEFLKEPDSSF